MIPLALVATISNQGTHKCTCLASAKWPCFLMKRGAAFSRIQQCHKRGHGASMIKYKMLIKKHTQYISAKALKSFTELSRTCGSDWHSSMGSPWGSLMGLSTTGKSCRKVVYYMCYYSYFPATMITWETKNIMNWCPPKIKLWNDTSTIRSQPDELVLAICLQSPGRATPDELVPSWRKAEFFWNTKASHVSSASQMEDTWDTIVGSHLILSFCLEIWAAIAASNESQLNGICWRHWNLPVRGWSMQLASKLWGTPERRSPTLMLVRLSAHSLADSAAPLCNLRPS